MKKSKIIFCLLIALAMINLAAMPLASAHPGALPTSHYMARDIRLNPDDSTATDVTVAGIAQPIGKAVIFKTLDQLTCNKGDYNITLRIIRVEDNLLIATTKTIPFTASKSGFVYTQPVAWQVYFPTVGWYRYDVLINNDPVAYYYFVVSFSL